MDGFSMSANDVIFLVVMAIVLFGFGRMYKSRHSNSNHDNYPRR